KNANEKLVDGGWIDISSNISLSKKSLVITIKDNGGGITLENPNDVFKAFVTTKGEFGTGIGLALSKSIVQDHGGTITADNWEETNDQGEVQEKGAIFRIFLPMTRVATEEKKTGTDHSMLSEELEKRGEQLYEMRHILRHELGNISGPLLSYKDLLMMDHEEFVNQDDNYVRVLDFVAGLNPRINFIFEEREAGFDRREIATEFEEFKQSVIDNRLDVLMYLSSLFGAMKNNPDFEEARDNLKRMINTYTRFYEYLNRVFDENLYKTKVNFPGIFNSAVRGVPKSASGLERLSDRESKGEVDILLSFEDLDQADVTLEVDELRFSEVLVNVLKNANEAMPQRGRLEVTSELVDSNILEIVFKDTGGGIQLDDPNAVFEEFVSTKGEYGTGVGLVLSKKIIEDHGGTITAENWKETNDGGIKVGAIFRITLPVIQNEEGSKTDRAILFDVKVADLAGGAKIYSTLSGNDFQRMLTEQKFYEVRDNNGVTSLFDTGRSWVTTDTPFATLNGRYGIMSKLIELGASTDADAEPIVVVDWGTGDAVGVIGLARELGDQGIRNVKIIAFANQIPVNWHNVQNSVTFILDTPNNFKAIYEKLMSDAGITKKIDLIYSNLGLSHYFKDGPRAEVTQHLEDLFSLLSSEGEIRTTIISGFGPVGIDSSQFRTKRVVEENYSSPEAWKAGRLFYYRISRTDYSDASMLGNEKDKIDSGAIKSFSAKDAILSAVRETVKNRYSIKGDISINPITGSFSEDVAGSIKYLFAEIANELIDNAVEAQKEDDILVKFDQVESGDVRFIVSNQGGIDWNKLINKAKKAANSGALFIDTSDGSYMAGEFYGALDGFEAVSEGDIDALTKDASGQLKLLTMGGITEEKGEGVQGGAGYGLTLVRARVKQLGGSLELDSRPDITTFTITIPKVSQVNYIEDATVDVEFDFIENSDTSMFGNEFAEEAGVLGVDEEDGEAIVQAARSLVTQVHDKLEGLTTVLISGYSSMLSKIMFEETWEHIYPEEAMPRVIALSGEVNKTLYKDQIALEIITPAWKKEDILQAALDDEGIDINDLRNYEKVLFLDEYVGSGQKLKMMRHTFTDQLSFNDIHFGFFFSQGSSNVEGEDMIVGTTDIHMSLELSSIAVELSDRTQLYERTQTARERFRKRDELESLITSFMRLGLAGESPIVESDVDGSSVGGIDLNTRNLDIETTGDGAGFEFSFDMNGYENITILGFSPVIIQIVPISNAAILIGQ
ncbi:MAG: hypothetical protein KKD07_00355, partial [Candidatus Omnitrophica bacterium]|nr:hypothetical protein [Candidatus Omnitrophota bacterium]